MCQTFPDGLYYRLDFVIRFRISMFLPVPRLCRLSRPDFPHVGIERFQQSCFLAYCILRVDRMAGLSYIERLMTEIAKPHGNAMDVEVGKKTKAHGM